VYRELLAYKAPQVSLDQQEPLEWEPQVPLAHKELPDQLAHKEQQALPAHKVPLAHKELLDRVLPALKALPAQVPQVLLDYEAINTLLPVLLH
jgi:hypothetical protein